MPTIASIHLSEVEPQARALGQSPFYRDVIFRHLAPGGGGAGRLNLKVHTNDQMLSHSANHLKSSGAALAQYFGVALQQHRSADQIIKALFPNQADIKILDFACGYGRMLRFLAHSMKPSQIWASDIQHDAVDFVSTEFGVQSIYSDADPAKFQPDQKFDFIWVASLFSHLPAPLFNAWLVKLRDSLSPRGVLCFSVHDESLLPLNRRTSDTGIYFVSESENDGLDKDQYGTTHVSEAYVASAINRAFNAPTASQHGYKRLKLGLAYQQDLYAVAKDAGSDLSALDNFRWGPWGWVDVRKLLPTGQLQLSGWATSFDKSAIDHVAISYDGQTLKCPLEVVRHDVEAVFQDARLRNSGWEMTCPLRAEAQSGYLEVEAVSSSGERSLLYAGPIVDPLVIEEPLSLKTVTDAATLKTNRLLTKLRSLF